MGAKQRIQKELDRLGLQIGQNFKVNDSSIYGIMHRINSYGAILFDDNSGETKVSGQSILTLEPEDIAWRELMQPDWSEDLLGWCKYVEDCWIAKDYTKYLKSACAKGIYIFKEKPVHEEDGDGGDYWNSPTVECADLGYISVKNCIISGLDEHLQAGKNGTVIQIIDSKPYLRQVIDGEIRFTEEINDEKE